MVKCKPIIREIAYQDPLLIFARFAEEDNSVFLDSAGVNACGEFSFIGIDPFDEISIRDCEDTLQPRHCEVAQRPWQSIVQLLAPFQLELHPEYPSFQGGAIGFLSYELSQHLEKLPEPKPDIVDYPQMHFGLYDLVIGFDHRKKQATIFSSGFPEEGANRISRANARINWLLDKLSEPFSKPAVSNHVLPKEYIMQNFSKEEYEGAVSQVIEHILAGDIFEANISQRFQTYLPAEFKPFDIYQRLRQINPAAFSAFLRFDDLVLMSASPERFLKLNGKFVETRPIKGTRKRGKNAYEDKQLIEELKNNPKDNSENIMIVDLLRNDLSKVCEDHSVQVKTLCGLETTAHVHHLVSVIHGTLRPECSGIDLLQATFPGGSITGAPKIRAMEIIAEIEPHPRGPYCGNIGYIGFNGDMDFSITIRTLVLKKDLLTFQVGGAIVADSIPEQEYFETLTKAHALFKTLTTSERRVQHEI